MLDLNKIYELAAGVETHLLKVESIADDLREIKTSLNAIRENQEAQLLWELQQIKQEHRALKTQLIRYGLPQANHYEEQLDQLREAIQDESWPLAVPPEAICNSDEKATQRANIILELVVGEYLKDQKFLDFGCGQGHVAAAAHQRGAIAVGYDVDLSQCKLKEPLFTADLEEVRCHGPYNVILLYDVLDHIALVDPIIALVQAKSLLAPNGRIYVRNHPWSSRHGGHLYLQTNKAFLHLVLDDVELTRLGGWSCEPNIKVIRPLETYRDWFNQAGLIVKSEIPILHEVEKFFLQPSQVHNRLVEHWGKDDEAANCMELEFVDFVVSGHSSSILP